MRRTVFVCVIVCLGAALSTTASAQGTLIPRPPRPDHPIHHTFSIASQHIDVSIRSQVATTEITQVFHNETNRDLEGTYLFPIPAKASVSSFTMWMNGEEVSGEVVEAGRARSIYEDIVRRMRDPGLLEYVGCGLFRARVYPITARSDARIRISYEEVLDRDAQIVTYRHPLKADARRVGRVGELSVAVTIDSDHPIKTLYSPTHDIDKRIRRRTARCGFEEREVALDRDFLLYYTVSDEDVGLNLLTHRAKGEDGYFVLLISPGDLAGSKKVMAKDVVFVLDKSGSMKGEKIEQAREALVYCVNGLGDDDRFNIITFSTSVTSFERDVVSASRANKRRALAFIEDIEAVGGTDIDAALGLALASDRGRRPRSIIFLTDGLPTVGETNIERILKKAKRENNSGARVFPFGVGYKVNTVLLDKLAGQHRGTVAYVKPKEDIEVKVSSFYDKISSPVMADIQLDLGRIDTQDVYPRVLPDLFSGSQLVVIGRYEGHGPAAIRLTGTVRGEPRELVYEGDFRRQTDDNEFIPRLWANRKIAYLLSEIKTNGHDTELVDEVIALSLEYGIITPYTSYLILEEGTEEERERLSRNEPARTGRVISQDADGGGGTSSRDGAFFTSPSPVARAPQTGRMATQVSEKLSESKAESVLDREDNASVRRVGKKRFVLRDEAWVDSEYKTGSATREIGFLSEAYFELIDKHPEVKAYLALGERVIFVHDGTAYEIVP